jgi:hypothetical protein
MVSFMQKAAILVNNGERLQEGLIACNNLLLKGMQAYLLLIDATAINAENDDNPSAVNQRSMDFKHFTNQPDVVGKYGFQHATLAQIAVMLKDADIVIPF